MAESVLIMEFHEKIQELRKKKGLTQEELAAKLYVSRTAISKWESGRGYPSIDSLKTLAEFFSVTVDDLLSGEELLTAAEEMQLQRERSFCSLVFGLLDLCAVLLLFLPLFAQRTADAVSSVSLLNVSGLQLYVKGLFMASILSLSLFGVLTLVLRLCHASFWVKRRYQISLGLSVVAGLLLTLCLQPYPAVLIFSLLGIKLLILFAKRR